MAGEQVGGMTLGKLREAGVEGRLDGPYDPRVTGVQHDSREVVPGDLFAAISGHAHDGLTFLGDALERGAVGVISESWVDQDVPQLTVSNVRLALARAAELVYGSPTSKLPTIGITGTNGKTTTASLLERAIEAASGRPAIMGTTGTRFGDAYRASLHTTPEGDDISRFASRSLGLGATHLILEVSSHGLALHRVDGLRFEVAAFTNLSRDHLDFHGTLEAYGEAKARLFTELEPECSVIHIDDAFGSQLAKRASGRVVRCSRRDGTAEISATRWSVDRKGLSASVDTPSGTIALRSRMLGEHNLENALVALGCAHALGLDLRLVASAWEDISGAPGRLERIEHPGDVAVLVDYAHTPEALRKALQTVRALTPRRLFVVFGAGGDRDRGKRPEMGRAAAETADVCIVTSDNPRSENPLAIVDEVEQGVRSAGSKPLEIEDLRAAERGYARVVDRRAAIGAAIAAAGSGDSVLLAGKGHETYQIIGTERIHFDDREEARAAIAALEGRN
jgi:UDP-N-acetylmuramoyl-L-alanyl-D-glutamate--2,6-diaminopimelate ligase